MSKCIYCGKEWLTNLSKYTYEDVCNECKNKYDSDKDKKKILEAKELLESYGYQLIKRR